MSDTSQNIPLTDIVPPLVQLRGVNVNSVEYLELQYSVRDIGFLNSISVRVSKTDPTKYEIIEGVHRYAVAVDLRLETMPCIVKAIEDDIDVLFAQLQANAIRIETQPCEYANYLDRILKADPDMSLIDLVGRLRKSIPWLRKLLVLNKLTRTLQQCVDRGEIPVSSARLIARFPTGLQEQYMDRARLLTYNEFAPEVRKDLKTFKENSRRGKMKEFYDVQYIPHPYLKQLDELVAEIDTCSEGAVYIALESLTPLEIWVRALQWVVHMDPKGIELQTKIYAGMQDKTENDIQRRKEDRRHLREIENNQLEPKETKNG